jgi:hypothetical protein
MISIAAFIIGIGIMTALGWLMLRVVEGSAALLFPFERIAWANVLGTTVSMLLIFLLHVTSAISLTRWPMLIALLIVIVAFAAIVVRKRLHRNLAPTTQLPKNAPVSTLAKRIGWALLAWIAIKLIMGSLDVALTPTYWDDSFNNWNLRGKAAFVRGELRLELPGSSDDATIGKTGVNSYPPTIPFAKTWLAAIRGKFSDGRVNSIHVVWYIALLVTFYWTLRRRLERSLALFGTYLLASLPLLTVQGFNPYADVFVAGHILIVWSALLNAADDHRPAVIARWMAIAALAMGLAVFTKNEVLVLHLPLFIAAAVAIVLHHLRSQRLSRVAMIRIIALMGLIGLAIVLPWLLFKWLNGLTFGNAKSILNQEITFEPAALQAVWFFLAKEANFLFLPMCAAIVAFAFRTKLSTFPIILPALFVVISMVLQIAIYVFTPLSTEAIMQTGIGRGFVQIAPIALFVVIIVTAPMLRSCIGKKE